MSRSDARIRFVASLTAGLALALLVPAWGQTADTQESAYRNSIAQESVRKQADKIQAELSQMVEELKLNGLGGPNLNMLSQASTHLSGLSQEEMQKVIDALQSASISQDDGKRQQSLVNAYQGQQDLVLKLKNLAAALAAQQAGDKLISEIEDLIARQSANIRQTSALDHTLDQLTAQEKTGHTLASSEQTSIGGQIDLLFSSLSSQASQPSTDPSTLNAKAVLDAMSNSMLKDTSAAAIQLTNSGPFPDAVTKQTAVKQYLIALLRAATSKSDATTRLSQAKNQLEQVMADQKDLNDVTKQQKLDPSTLAQRQAEINDRADVAKALLAQLNPTAAQQIDQAQQDMQKSTADLNNPQTQADAQTQQQAAQQALANADQDVDQQIAQVQQQQNQSPTQQMAQIQKALDEVKQAQQEQQISPQEAAKDAQQAQQDALSQSSDAANALADASDQLQQQAQQNQQNQQNANSQQNGNSQQQNSQQASNAQQSQQQNSQQGSQRNQSSANQAAQDLAQAAQALQNQQSALQQAAQNYQALADAQAALNQAQQDAQAAQQNMQNGTGNNLTDPARKLTDAQNQANQVAQNQSSALPPDAQQAVQQAANDLKNGAMQAVQANRSGAEAQTQQAISALQQAQAAVSKAMAQVAQQSQQKMGMGQQMAQNQQNQNASMQVGGTGADPHDQQVLKGVGRDAQRGTALVVGGLSPKDRDAITQYQAEKTPAEYATLVQQYLKNLADTSETH